MKCIGIELGDHCADRLSLEKPQTGSHEVVELFDRLWEVKARLSSDGLSAFPDWKTLCKRKVWRDYNEIDLSRCTQLNESEIELLWEHEEWDGPLSGTAKYHNQICWFDYNNDDAEGRHFFYKLYPLTAQQIDEIETNKSDPHWMGPIFNIPPIGWFMDGKNQDFYAVQLETIRIEQKE